MKLRLLAASAALLWGMGSSWAGPLENGVAAYARSDYPQALASDCVGRNYQACE